jgi:hypothetical protein
MAKNLYKQSKFLDTKAKALKSVFRNFVSFQFCVHIYSSVLGEASLNSYKSNNIVQ